MVEARRQAAHLRLLLYRRCLVSAVQGIRCSTWISAANCAQLRQGINGNNNNRTILSTAVW